MHEMPTPLQREVTTPMYEIDLKRRDLLRKTAIGVGAGALALAAIKPALAETVLTDSYIETGETKERLAKSATVVIGKSGAVDYLTTDYGSDDACIQAAIDYVNGVGGGSVLIREGTYIIVNSITLYSNIILQGSGYGNTIFDITNGVGTVLDGSSAFKTVISGIKFEAETGNTDYAIKISTQSIVNYCWFYQNNIGVEFESARCGVYNCLFEKCLTLGTDTPSGTDGNNVIDCMIDNCMFIRDGYTTAAIRFRADSGATRPGNNQIYNALIVDTIRGVGVQLEFQEGFSMANVTIDRVYSKGLYINNVIISSFSNIYITQDTGNGIANSQGIYMSTGSSNNAFTNIEVRGTLGQGIEVNASHRNSFNNTLIYEAGLNGILVQSANHNKFSNIEAQNSQSGSAVRCADSSNNIIQSLHAWDDQGTKTQEYAFRGTGTSDNNTVANGNFEAHLTGYISIVNSNSFIINNQGYNPFGAVGPPSVPATTVNYTNAYGYPCQVQVYGGTVTEIDIDDIATGLTSGIFMIPPGGTINITYSAAPSWRWWGL